MIVEQFYGEKWYKKRVFEEQTPTNPWFSINHLVIEVIVMGNIHLKVGVWK